MKVRSAVALAAAASVIGPAGASAATWTVTMGALPKDSSFLQEKYSSEANAYFPSTLKVRVGDTVKFASYGFHNADFPKKGGRPTGLLAPAGTTTGVNDAAGNPFWFNGQPELGFNPALLDAQFGKTVTFSPAKGYNTGLPLGDDLKPAAVKFTKQGSFTYYCAVHFGMKGQIQVKGKNATIPSASGVKQSVAKQVAKAKKDAAAAARTKAPTNTVLMGAIKGSANYFGFLPGELSIPAGTTVDFKMPAGSMEVHSATFGPGVPASPDKEPTGYLGEIAKSFESPKFDSRGIYSSEAPGTFASFTTALHGNGFWNSGVLDASSATPLPRSNKVTFGEAGTFRFLCVIHPFMQGTIKVT